MWVAKIKFSSKGTLIGEKAQKYKVNVFGFPLSYCYEKDCVIVQVAGTLIGNEINKKQLFEELKKEKRVINLEIDGDFIIGTIKEPHYTNDLYQRDIFHLSPAFMSSEGYEIIEIGSFNRALISRIIKIFERRYAAELLSFQNKKVKTLSVVKFHPNLTDRQKRAFELAVKNGYYNSPRKTSVEKLAKISGLSFSTYQVHLRKAESKLMPYFSQ
jgi:predicted DNA binding protein